MYPREYEEVSFTRDVLGNVSAVEGPTPASYGLGATLVGWNGLTLG